MPVPMQSKPILTAKYATAWGIVCGAGAALFWALGFVAARQGVTSGLSPLVIALHRFVWPGFALLPLVAKNNFADLRMIGLPRAAALALFGGLPLALLSYVGYVLVPLGHGAVIQPSCAALGGLVLARLVLKEPLPPRRIAGAAVIVIGLAVIGAEALRTIGGHGVLGDLLFVAAGSCFAIFGVLVRHWRIGAIRATAVTSVLSLAGLPILLFSFGNMLAAGFYENGMQAIVQGALAGAGAIYLFTRAVVLLGAGRAVLFPSLVPPFTLLIGYFTIGEAPSVSQLAGLVIVIAGFRLTQRA
ncbi:MAG TPA: DMT family transporter [Xanthobacteraceae bacterium]|jgi:drug/metabolite transporter (DMT)-like permease|nr:DMT family transporter [Xanthobacteraceae bacterium]